MSKHPSKSNHKSVDVQNTSMWKAPYTCSTHFPHFALHMFYTLGFVWQTLFLHIGFDVTGPSVPNASMSKYTSRQNKTTSANVEMTSMSKLHCTLVLYFFYTLGFIWRTHFFYTLGLIWRSLQCQVHRCRNIHQCRKKTFDVEDTSMSKLQPTLVLQLLCALVYICSIMCLYFGFHLTDTCSTLWVLLEQHHANAHTVCALLLHIGCELTVHVFYILFTFCVWFHTFHTFSTFYLLFFLHFF